MEVIYVNEEPIRQEASVTTIGFFDGVHRGHVFLIEEVKRRAHQAKMASAVVTFDRHPREVIDTAGSPKMLSNLHERLERLHETGIDYCFVIHFDATTAQLSAHHFMQDVLQERLNVRQLVIGYDNRFGHNRTEGFEDYARFGKEIGIEVVGCEGLTLKGKHVSSSVIRRHLLNGEVEQAEHCLGYRYSLTGIVESGEQEGRKMGFPTANLQMDDQRKLIPQNGVYAVWVTVEHETERRLGMMNIGRRPTFGTHATTIEVHIIGFDGDLYGKRLTIWLLRRLRGEHPFRSPEELADQLQKDRDEVMSINLKTKNK